jgi:hypothetical protein
MVSRYQKRISGPLLDRIDIHIEVPRVEYEKLSSDRLGEPSAAIRARVEAARERQRQRFKGTRLLANADALAVARVGPAEEFEGNLKLGRGGLVKLEDDTWYRVANCGSSCPGYGCCCPPLWQAQVAALETIVQMTEESIQEQQKEMDLCDAIVAEMGADLGPDAPEIGYELSDAELIF